MEAHLKEFGGWYFPAKEAHFPEWMAKRNEMVDGRLTYQYHKLSAALKYVRQFRIAIDVGAHIGTWAHYLSAMFDHVHAFEPVADFRVCFLRNVSRADHVTLYSVALGAAPAMVGMHIVPSDTGGTYVAGSGEIEMRTLDSFELLNVDFLKVDCEGGEFAVVQGARETLKRCKPCCVIEQKSHKLGPNFGIKGTPAVALLLEMGAKLRQEISGDYILSWD